jgi:hypothetical protein
MNLFHVLPRVLGSLFVVALGAPACQGAAYGLFAQVQPTPEPSSIILLGLGAAGLVVYSVRKKQQRRS